MEMNVIVKCLFYATYGYVMYAYDVLSAKLERQVEKGEA